MDRRPYPTGCVLGFRSQPAPPTTTQLPKGRGDCAAYPRGVFRWASSADHEQVEFRLAQLVTNSRSEFGFPFRGLNWTLLWWGFEQRDEAEESPKSSGQPLVCAVFRCFDLECISETCLPATLQAS